MVTLCHPGLTYIFRAERQSARMSEIKNVVQTWMALNTFKCNYLTSLHFKELICHTHKYYRRQ